MRRAGGRLVEGRGDILGLGIDAGTSGDADTATDGGAIDTSLLDTFATPASRTTPLIADGNVIFTMGSLRAGATIAAVDKDTAELKWRTPLDDASDGCHHISPALDGDTIYVGVSSYEEVAARAAGLLVLQLPRQRRRAERDDRQDQVEDDMIEDSVVLPDRPQDAVGLCRRRDLERNADGRSQARASVRHHGQQLLEAAGRDDAAAAGRSRGVDRRARSGDGRHQVVEQDGRSDRGRLDFRELSPAPTGTLGCGANLFRRRSTARVRDVVGAGQKSGVYWASNADTGKRPLEEPGGPGRTPRRHSLGDRGRRQSCLRRASTTDGHGVQDGREGRPGGQSQRASAPGPRSTPGRARPSRQDRQSIRMTAPSNGAQRQRAPCRGQRRRLRRIHGRQWARCTRSTARRGRSSGRSQAAPRSTAARR